MTNNVFPPNELLSEPLAEAFNCVNVSDLEIAEAVSTLWVANTWSLIIIIITLHLFTYHLLGPVLAYLRHKSYKKKLNSDDKRDDK